MSPTTTSLDSAFGDESDEIIERALLVYRPILSHMMIARLRKDLHLALDESMSLKPWRIPGALRPVHGTGALTAGQVALLGGTRPTRTLHIIASSLGVLLDGGDKRTHEQADQLLLAPTQAFRSLLQHHVVVPTETPEARLEKVREFVAIGIATEIAALMGALHEHHMWAGGEVAIEDEPEFIRRYFAGALQVFGRIGLSRTDQAIFRDHYLEARDLEELADERDGLAAEVERRRGFLKRLAAALEAEIDGLTGRVGHDGRSGDPGSLPSAAHGKGDTAPRALSPATARATRPRKR